VPNVDDHQPWRSHIVSFQRMLVIVEHMLFFVVLLDVQLQLLFDFVFSHSLNHLRFGVGFQVLMLIYQLPRSIL